MISALSGTRMGRKVKTVDEVLAEAQGWGTTVVGPNLAGQTDGGLDSPAQYFEPDIFRFAKFRYCEDVDAIVLTGLEVNEGTWERIWLDRLEYGQQSLTPVQWEKYSIGQATVDKDGKFVETLVQRENRQVTTKSLYWFMRAAYEVRDKPEYAETISQLGRFLTRPILTADRLVRFSDKPLVRVETHGWPDSHPLCVYKTFKSENRLFEQIGPDCDIQPLCETLFGDSDPERIAAVYSWLCGSTKPVLFEYGLRPGTSGAVRLQFDLPVHNPRFVLLPIESESYTLGMQAQQSWFKPRGVKT